MIDALLIYPKLGSMDTLVVDPPLSIIYAAADAVKRGRSVRLVDMRIQRKDWKKTLAGFLDRGVKLVGVSVMTGQPIRYARRYSRFIKEHYPGVKVVWGGPHPTVLPETISEDYLDFLIRGYGSKALAELLDSLDAGDDGLANIKGLSYKIKGRVFHNQRSTEHEMLSFRDVPYDLLDLDSPHYARTYMGQRMFTMFTSIGCPYRCSFCVHPTVYRVINGSKWVPYPDQEVVDHMQFLVDRYRATHICFLDDTSFPDLERMRRIFSLILERGLKVTLEFRGARVNEIDRMDDEFLDLMAAAGGRVLMVGVESASDRVLKNMQKGISKKQIIRVNRKLARHPKLVPHYNFIYGTPGETYQDLLETKDVILQLVKDNPNAYFGFGGDWKPIPGSRMLKMAEDEFGYRPPQTLDQWIEMDSSDGKSKIFHPWYTTKHNNLIKILQMASFVIDDGLIKQTQANKTMFFRILRVMSRIYKPIALLRLEKNLTAFPVEYICWQWAVRALPYLAHE